MHRLYWTDMIVESESGRTVLVFSNDPFVLLLSKYGMKRVIDRRSVQEPLCSPSVFVCYTSKPWSAYMQGAASAVE